MKKLNYFMVAILAVFAFSCDNNDEPPPVLNGPSINGPSVATTVQVGKVVTMTFGVTAPGKVATVSVTSTGGDVTLIDPNPIIGETLGDVVVTYTAPLLDADYTVTLSVTDAQNPALSTTNETTVSVTLGATSSSELMVATFTSAPVLDGEIDDMWNLAQQLVSTTTVPSGLGARNTYYNEDGIGEENLDIFEAYEGSTNDFTMRSGYFGTDIYFLIEWEDGDDSKDRQSWYFDPANSRWKTEHKYANAADDKFYEDKFAFLFPIGEVDNFSTSTCFATCHSSGGVINNSKDKHTRHYLKTPGQKVDMWHWKRVRSTHNDKIDDQRIQSVSTPFNSSSNGRGGDPDSGGGSRSGYSNNKQTLNNGVDDVSVPKYVVPGGTDYYWIPEADLGGTAKLVTAVDANGVLTYDGGTIDPAGDAGYNQGTGNKRFPSILTRDFKGERADLDVKVTFTGTGWIAEIKRKLNTGDDWDVVFDPATELDFGFAIFDNAAIAHGIKPGLKLTWEQ